jgi:hypothetical protein
MATPEIVHVASRSRLIWHDVSCERCGVALAPGMLSVRDEKDFVFENLPPDHVWCERSKERREG